MIYISLRENLFPPWNQNRAGQLSVKIYTDAHYPSVSLCLSHGSKNL